MSHLVLHAQLHLNAYAHMCADVDAYVPVWRARGRGILRKDEIRSCYTAVQTDREADRHTHLAFPRDREPALPHGRRAGRHALQVRCARHAGRCAAASSPHPPHAPPCCSTMTSMTSCDHTSRAVGVSANGRSGRARAGCAHCPPSRAPAASGSG